MEKNKIKYRVEIPFLSCCVLDVERDEEMSKDELIDSITGDELLDLRLLDDGEHTYYEVKETLDGWSGLEITNIQELDEKGEVKQND